MSNLQTFNHAFFGDLEVLIQDGKEYFPASDVARVLGYTNPQKAIRDHCSAAGCTTRSVRYPSGTKQKKFINEGNLYRLIVKSKLPSAEKFEKWVFEDVLPTIRQHGAYMTPEVIEKTLTNPDFIIQLATQLKSEQEARIAAEETIAVQAPKVEAFEDLMDTSPTHNITTAAKILGIDRNGLFEFLRGQGVLLKKPWNMPSQKHRQAGYFTVKYVPVKNDYVAQPQITAAGVEFVRQLLKKYNLITQ